MENIEKCGTCRCNKICDHNKHGFENCGNYISADAAPKSEVAREIFKELDEALAYCLESHPFAIERYNEIRKKYIGE